MTHIFERIVTDDMVEDAVVATLQKWIDTEMRIIEEQRGLQIRHYRRPRTWEIKNELTNWPEEALPAVIVISMGPNGESERDGKKKYRTRFNLGIACIASSTSIDKSRRYCHLLAGAVRATMVHRQSLDNALDDTVRGVNWLGGFNGEVPTDQDRTIWRTRQVFEVEVADVLTQSAGPVTPDVPPIDEPLPEWPTVPDREHITVSYEKEPIE